MKIEFEFADGSSQVVHFDGDDPWELVRDTERSIGESILSGWRDDQPWFGLCADMREGTP